ncbi:MAG: hypothetical protein O7D30_12830, partial [Rickettsia endosymbiont of Ixodes persulcatus]|nr:hypothetical protein [Rickettsia endosymbiont of Ixodes persulcatus]
GTDIFGDTFVSDKRKGSHLRLFYILFFFFSNSQNVGTLREINLRRTAILVLSANFLSTSRREDIRPGAYKNRDRFPVRTPKIARKYQPK